MGNEESATGDGALMSELESEVYETGGLSARVQLNFRCANLANRDVMSKSDPFVVVEQAVGGRWKEIGRTEVVKNNLNPNFVQSAIVEYRFEEVQNFRFSVYDADDDLPARQLVLARQDYIGSAETALARVVSNPKKSLMLQLSDTHKPGKSLGSITIFGEEVAQNSSLVSFSFSLSGLPFTGPVLAMIYRQNVSGDVTACYKSEVVQVSKGSAFFKMLKISSISLCNSQDDRPIVFKIYKYKRAGDHKCRWTTQLTLRGMRNQEVGRVQGLESYASQMCGTLRVENLSEMHNYTFLNYIQSGCEMNFMVAIDFTGSNGHPADWQSLHYMDPSGKMNQYEQAITAIGGVLEYYDTDKMFPSYLFGGKVNGKAEHCYPLNGNYGDPELSGIQGIMEWYRTALRHIELYGPTLFTQVIRTAATIASQYDQPTVQQYLVLLILTDGQINDDVETVEAIIDMLDGDRVKLCHKGRYVKRDIVQFVPFNRYKQDPVRLAKEVLEEVPKQLLEYMSYRGKIPGAI